MNALMCEQLLLDEIARLNNDVQELLTRVAKAHTKTSSVKAGMGMAVAYHQRRADKAEAKLVKFDEWLKSNGCYARCSRVQIVDVNQTGAQPVQ